MTNAPADPMIGRLIDGRYQVRSRIARGGMATVYLATDLRLERRVAIKIMHGHLADDNTFKTRFVQEARSAARLAHPNVVNVFDQGQDADMAYLVMEYLPGITLRELLKDYKQLTPEQTVDIMDAVLSGLAAAHKAGIVHRDLKPENVLLADDGRIKLGDFGLARAASANTATGQALLGTIAYLSPELVTRGVADARSDIYAVGIMMFEMLTGEQPYVGEAPMTIAYQHANDEVPAPSSKNPAVPGELDELVLWATRRDPDERPRDARELLDKLREAEPVLRASHVPITTHATMVLPAVGDQLGTATAETRVLGDAALIAGPAVATLDRDRDGDDVDELAASTARRKRRGYWLLALVLLVTGLAAGTGWYFGAGPGAYVTIPTTANESPETALALLADAGFEVTQETRTDPEVPAGAVIDTDPAGGSSARNGSTVTLLVSEGPRILDVPDVVGATADDAAELLAEFTLLEPIQQFSGDVEAGSVIGALGADGAALPATYPERGEITLIVSVGPVPPVEGLPIAEAEQKLKDVGLTVVIKDPIFSNDVPKDHVVTADWMNDPMRPGSSTVELTASKGQDLVAVPKVIGKKLEDAISELEAAGFKVTHSFPAAFIAFATVSEQNPAGDAQAVRGSTITLVATLTV